VIVGNGGSDLTVRVDLFTNDGLPMTATLNGETKSSFTNILVREFGVVTLAPRDGRSDSGF
jgi:hypothetical protein